MSLRVKSGSPVPIRPVTRRSGLNVSRELLRLPACRAGVKSRVPRAERRNPVALADGERSESDEMHVRYARMAA